ncbi:hypothetical protein [Aliikangiella maris]|uniref:Bacterial virulence factor lipase N-terminal domain-containing protein n=2 Tax=Aliikangiella maris TaxID=3162458 RepID=A0ABV3MRN2_9GAMM
MKNLMLGFAFATGMALVGCSDGPKEPLIPDGTDGSGGVGGVALTKPVFIPSEGKLPLPNDILFSGTQNLTLNIPVADESDFSNPLVAISSLDGWSATAPFSIAFSNTRGVDLNSSTVVAGTTIRIFQVNVNRPEAVPGTGILAPTGPVTGIVKELQPGTDFVVAHAAKLTVAVVPTKPLTPQASYMVVVTNGIKDANDNAIIADGQYAIAKVEDPIPPGNSTSALEPLRQLVNAMENTATSAGIAKENIVLSYQFTVQSVGDVVATAKLAYIDTPLALGARPHTAFSSLMTDTTPFTGRGEANLYKGEIGLNYYLTAPDSLLNQSHPGSPDPLSVLNDFFLGAAEIPVSAELSVPNPFAGDVVTYANKLPAITGVEIAPLLVSMPKAENCPKPAAGYPVMIFQHGITSNRTSMLGIADTMAKSPVCTAVVAMDLPLHGIAADNAVHRGLQMASNGLLGIFAGYDAGDVRERTFGVDYISNSDGAPGPDTLPDPSGAHAINLQNLLTTRDNGRQAILDLLALEKAIRFMDVDGDTQPDFDYQQIKFMGHSLGGILGTGFIGHSDYVKAAVLANPSGGLALMLSASEQFGKRIRDGLAAAGIEPYSAQYQAFLFAMQTVLDPMDPAAVSSYAVANGVPTLMLQVANDTVIPALVANAPLSGTTPLAAMLALDPVNVAEPGYVAGARLFSRFNTGTHSSVLSPAEGGIEITTELQTQIASFLASPESSKAVLVANPALLLTE